MGKTVLVVDDILFVRKTLVKILTQAHYQVVGEAADGREAVALFKRLKPSAVTMDLVMPTMNGIEASRQIVKYDPEAKIVMITAMGQESLIMEALNAGVKDYVLKPFTAKDVLLALDRALMDQSISAKLLAKEKINE